jgi:hypothetical protein
MAAYAIARLRFPGKGGLVAATLMGFALKLAPVHGSEIHRKVSETAQLLELTPLLDRRPANLSGSGSGSPWAAPSSAARRRSSWTSH